MPHRRRLNWPDPKPQASTVRRTTVDPATIRVALHFADGDRSRLKFNPDGSVLVMNQPRRRSPRP